MVSIIKLVDGTEVVGLIVQEDQSVMMLKDPLQINYRQRPDTLPAIYLHRYIPFAGVNTFEFKKEHILNKVKPLENLERYYSAVLKTLTDGIDSVINDELANAAIEAGNDEMSEEEMIKVAMMEKKALKIALN